MTQTPGGAAQAAQAAQPSATPPASQTTATVGAPAPAPAPADQEARRISENVPQLLNRLQVIAVAALVVFGLLGGLIQVLTWQAGDRAATHAEQLIRVQDIRSSLYRADALATNAFLFDGLEPAAQRAEYDRAISHVLEAITSAAREQPADRAALGALSEAVSDYTNAITEARVNNRQGFPVGSEYLLDASAALREGAEPVFDNLVKTNTERADDDMSSSHPWWLLFLGALVLVVLWWVNREIARRFRRRINQGLLLAAIIVAVVGFLSVAYATSTSTGNDDLRAEEFADAVAFAEARTAANDAKANESLMLIRRGSGAEFEELWKADAERIEEQLSGRGGMGSWTAYASDHAKIVEHDARGEWETAVKLATSTGEKSPSSDLAAFDGDLAARITESGDTVVDELSSNEIGLGLAALTLLGGLVAAGAAAWGVGLRRKEYA